MPMMGHFGRSAICISWFAFVLPALFWFTSAKERLCWPIRHRRTIPFSSCFRTGC